MHIHLEMLMYLPNRKTHYEILIIKPAHCAILVLQTCVASVTGCVGIFNEHIIWIFWSGTNRCLHRNSHKCHNFRTPIEKTEEGFSVCSWLQKLFWCCGVFDHPLIVHIFTQLSCNTVNKRERESYQGNTWQEQSSLATTSTEIREQISEVCIFAVFGGGPTFGIMNSLLVFIVRVDGQWQSSLRFTHWRGRRERN